MVFALLDGNTVTSTNDSAYAGYIEAPDGVTVGWEKNGNVWSKSAALVTREAAEAALATKRANASNVVATLRSWSTDAATAAAAWDAQTQTQKNATTKVVIERLGTFMSRFADLIEGNRL